MEVYFYFPCCSVSMIEKLVSSILAKQLGEYVEGIREDSVKISLLSGEFKMTNPALREDALDSLELPITVKSGMNTITIA